MDYKLFGTLFFSQLAVITGVGIVVPLLPVYAQQLGGNGFLIGLIFGSFSISRTCFLPYFGRLSDINGRKPFILTGLLGYALISVTFMFVNDIYTLITIRFFQGIFSAMIMPVVTAYVGEITPRGKEGSVTGLFNVSLFGSLSMGPIIGGLLNDHFNMNAAFASMGILALIGFLLAFFLLPPRRLETSISRNKPPVAWSTLLKSPLIAGLFFFRLSYTTCIGVIWGFVPILGKSEFNLSSARIGVLVMQAVLVNGILQIPMGYVADRANKKIMVIIGGVIAATCMYCIEWASSFWGLFIATSCFGLGGGISNPAISAMSVIKGKEMTSMGSVLSILIMAHSLGMFVGSIGAGIIMDVFNLNVAFIASSILLFIGMIVFLICTKYETSGFKTVVS